MTARTTSILRERVENLQSNTAVKALLFASISPDLFSTGLDAEATKEDVQGMHFLSSKVRASKHDTITVFGGEMNGTGFAAFMCTNYKLGTPSLSFRMNELTELGVLPRGGLAHYFYHSNEDGKSFARYLGVTGKEARADDLYHLGMITHLVEEDPQSSFTHALAHTVPNRSEEHRGPVRGDTIEELLDTMSVESDLDVMSHEAWNEFVLVPPGRWDTQEKEESMISAVDDLDLVDVQAWVIKCFSSDSLEECKASLAGMAAATTAAIDDDVDAVTTDAKRAVAAQWAAQCLACIDKADPNVVQGWWECTGDEIGSSMVKVRILFYVLPFFSCL
jgi:enoyl-CoA hydratase/carnithine racemase